MKRLFSICLLSLACALSVNAKIGFLVHTAYNDMPAYDTQNPEQAAYDWFKTNYVDNNILGEGEFVTIAQLKEGLSSDIKVLWINVERNTTEAAFDLLFPETEGNKVLTALQTFGNNGGNLLLTKKANRLVSLMGRMQKNDNTDYHPSWSNSGYNDPNSDTWTINAQIGAGYTLRDARQHPIFASMSEGIYNSYAHQSYPLVGTVSRTDDNCIWTEMYRKDGTNDGNANLSQLQEFESDWNCQVLAVWGHVRDYVAPVIVEFFPASAFAGTVMSIGSNAYQWDAPGNTHQSNIEKLTENALNYLSKGGTKYGYYMPHTLSENYSREALRPDYEAAKWFYDTYVANDSGCFVHKGQTFPEGMKVLWVNNDRKDEGSSDYYTGIGGDDFKNSLNNFVKAGGNVFLTKQATRLVNDIGRCSWAPSYIQTDYVGNNDTWYMTSNFSSVGSGVDRHEHRVFQFISSSYEDSYHWPLLSKNDADNRRTDHKYMWGEPGETWNGTYSITEGNTSIERLNKFETAQYCKILGGWGHTTNLDGVGMVEFLPRGDHKGFIIALGIPAYQWTSPNPQMDNVKNLSKGVLYYLSRSAVVTEPDTEIPNPVYNLIIHQGGSISNTENIVVKDSITYIRPVVGGSASNELGHWYTFCLPFMPTKCYIYDETDKADYEINSVYLTGSDVSKNSPEGEGSFYLQTFPRDADNNWTYIGNPGIPSKDKPYIIKFLNASEDGGKGSAWATYFTSNPTVKFKGGAQTVTGTDDGTGGDANGDYSYHVNKTLHKITLSNVYTLNTAENYFEYDYGGTSVIMPFECYIKASSPAKALARPRIAIGPNKTQEETNTATDVESVYIDSLMPVAVYDLMGRMFYSGQMPETLPQGVWIIRQGSNSFKLINR